LLSLNSFFERPEKESRTNLLITLITTNNEPMTNNVWISLIRRVVSVRDSGLPGKAEQRFRINVSWVLNELTSLGFRLKHVSCNAASCLWCLQVKMEGLPPHEHVYIIPFTLNITVFNATFSTSVFTLVQHVSATLGHHQVILLFLLKLSHCNLAFMYAHLFICLILCFTFFFL
jgi:hypothetical protein